MEMQVVYDLIKAGEDVRIDYGRGITALHWAANFSYFPNCVIPSRRANAATMLLNARADANARDFAGDTPLHVALNTRAWPVFQVLLQHRGTDVNAPDASGKTLLMLMLQSLCEATFFEDLIKAGASVNARDSEQKTVLHYAAALDKYDELNLLLKYGADANAVDQNKMTALHWAGLIRTLDVVPPQSRAILDYNKSKIVKSLLDAGADASMRDSDGATPLHTAVIRKDMNAFMALLYRTTNLNTRTTSCGMTPLIAAADLGMEHMVYYLVSAGADINAKNRNGATALHFAARLSNIPKYSEPIAASRAEAARLLLDAGADPNLRDNFGDTVLHQAIKSKAWTVFQHLLRYSRTDLNAHSARDGKTPLMMILESDVDLDENNAFLNLIEAGAALNETDNKGQTAMHYAAKLKNKHEELCWLIEYNADVNAADETGNTPLLLAAELDLHDNYEMIEAADNANRDVQRASDGKTLLMIMLESNPREHEFQCIVDQVTKINAKDKKLQTALHYAAKLDKNMELLILMESGAKVDVRDCDGQTPLFVAVREGFYETCYDLIKTYFANRDIPDNRGNRPIDIASEMDDEEIVMLLNESMPAG